MYSIRERWNLLVNQIQDRDVNVALVSMSILGNVFMSLAKLFYGIWVHSGWLLFNVVYVVVIGMFRYQILSKYVFSKTIPDKYDCYYYEFRAHKYSSVRMFILGVIYMCCSLRMFIVGDAVTIPMRFLYYFAAFAVIKLAFALRGMRITRKREDPIVRTMKVMGFADAGVALVELIYAVMSFFHYPLAAQYSSMTGILVSFLMIGGGIVMFLRKRIGPDVINADNVNG